MPTGYTDTFGGSPVQPSDVSYVALTLSASINVYWPSFATGTQQPVARLMDVSSPAPYNITLPDARQAGVGQDLLINNVGSSSFNVLDSTGVSLATIAPGQQKYFYLASNTTQAGLWRVTLFGIGSSTLDASQLIGYGVKAIGSGLNQSMPVVLVSANQSVNTAFRAQCYANTGGAITYTLATTAVVGNDFFFVARNQGTGVLTITPTGGELIDGVASLQLQMNESCIVVAGTGAWYTVGRGRNTQFNFTQLLKTVTGGTVTLSLAEASNIVQNYNGVLTSNCTVVLPAVVQVYYISNTTTGAFSLTFQSPTPGTTFVLPSNQAAVVFCNGVNVTNTTTAISGITSLLLNGGSVGAPTLAFTSANNGIYAPSSASVAVTAAGVEHMRWVGNQGLSGYGSAAAPAYSFQGDAGTGMLRSAANTLGFSTNAALRATFDATGNFAPAVTNTQTLGGASLIWSNVYANNFSGPGTGLTGTAAGLSIGGSSGSTVNATNATNASFSTTQTVGDNSTKIATTAFVAAASLAAAGIPTQAGNGGKLLTTDGSAASWTAIKTINGAALTGSSSDLVLATLGVQTFTGAQRGTIGTLTDASPVAVDISLANQFNLVLTSGVGATRALGVPTNVVAGQQGTIAVYQDTAGSRLLTYSWVYGWAGGTAGVLSTAGCTKDLLGYSVDYYSSGNFTVTIATPGVCTKNGHGYISGQKCQLSTTGALPTGLAAATTYYIHVINANDFHLCTSLANVAAGTYINTSGGQSPTHTIVCASITLNLSKAVP